MKDIALKKILIKTKRSVFSEIIGNNTSLFKGEGYDFAELREYEIGDDIRKIDWIISAKMQKPYVKLFYAQRELNISIVPILGGSVYFGSKRFKQDLIAEICSILGYSCVKQGDPYACFIANEKVELTTKKTKSLFGVYSMVEKVFNYDVLNKKTDFKVIPDELYKKIRKRSILFLIGDFLDIDVKELNLKTLAKKHEVIAIVTRDRFEEDLGEIGNANLVDPASAKNYEGNISSALAKNYRKKIKEHDHKLHDYFQKSGIKFTKIYTDEDPLVKLLKLMK